MLETFGHSELESAQYVDALTAALETELLSRAGAVLTDAISKAYRKYAFHVSADTPIVIATLGNDAGIYGCARMILR